LGAYSIQENPENTYLLLHAEPGWKALEFLFEADGDKMMASSIENLFRTACDNVHSTTKEEGTIMDCSDISFADHEVRTKFELKSNNNVTFVTGNKKKLEEVQRILSEFKDGKLPFTITSHKLDLPELQGEPIDIAKAKCALAAKDLDGPVITEDTSLCFDALNGLPGPYIKWFLEKCGHEGLNQMLAGYEDKGAYAQTMVAFCAGPGEEIHVFDGRTHGQIVNARGKLDFGWDPIFEPDEGDGKTYAEMTKDEKDSISHRSRAFTYLREFLLSKEG